MEESEIMETKPDFNEYKKTGYIHEAVFITILMVFAVWRWLKSSFKNSNVFQDKLRTIGSLLMLMSIASSLVYNYLLIFLSSKFEIDKYEFELVGYTNYEYMFKNVNLFEVLNVSYLISKILRISSLYMLIGLWGPCLYSYVNNSKYGYEVFASKEINSKIYISKDIFQTSIITFSKVYSVLRIPGIILLYFKIRELGTASIVFFESLIHGSEIYLCIALMLVLKTRHGFLSGYKGLDTISLLGFALGLFGFLSYSINSIAIPFPISDVLFQVKQSLIFALRTTIDLLLVSMFCPIGNQVFDGEDKIRNNLFAQTNIEEEKYGYEKNVKFLDSSESGKVIVSYK
ncbi:hypothetical protein NGRA_0561 [Nosema granulosis]|uniref:Uncharacterized protein n=1 Tax=Nosema granulosis TaxID=83296 RepID=A0A9P6H2U1_9MICR|nr:hypothetical protein NGRA_0561 [Nosema granulosis]